MRCVLALIFALPLGCMVEKKTTAPAVAAKKTWTRDEFRAAVIGKTTEEVKALVGPPDSTQDDGEKTWYYRERTVDPDTGKRDWNTQVNFDKTGRVRSVNF